MQLFKNQFLNCHKYLKNVYLFNMSQLAISSFNRKPHTVLTYSSKGFFIIFHWKNTFEGITYARNKNGSYAMNLSYHITFSTISNFLVLCVCVCVWRAYCITIEYYRHNKSCLKILILWYRSGYTQCNKPKIIM